MSKSLWVKLITANPLKGPCEGQVQFTVEWVKRRARHVGHYDGRGYDEFSYAGKRHRIYEIAARSYGTITTNYCLVFSPTGYSITLTDGRTIQLTPDNGNLDQLLRADHVEPPTLRPYRVWANDSNDRREIGRGEHWDLYTALESEVRRYLRPYYAAKALQNVDGDDLTAYATWYEGRQSQDYELESNYISVEWDD